MKVIRMHKFIMSYVQLNRDVRILDYVLVELASVRRISCRAQNRHHTTQKL